MAPPGGDGDAAAGQLVKDVLDQQLLRGSSAESGRSLSRAGTGSGRSHGRASAGSGRSLGDVSTGSGRSQEEPAGKCEVYQVHNFVDDFLCNFNM